MRVRLLIVSMARGGQYDHFLEYFSSSGVSYVLLHQPLQSQLLQSSHIPPVSGENRVSPVESFVLPPQVINAGSDEDMLSSEEEWEELIFEDEFSFDEER